METLKNTDQNIVQITPLGQWLDNCDVMRMLNISRRTLQNWRTCGILPYAKIGCKLYYKRADIESMLNGSYHVCGDITEEA